MSQEAYDEDIFWAPLRNELTAYVNRKGMTQITIHSVFSTIRTYISTAFPDLELLKSTLWRPSKRQSSTETPKCGLLMKELRGRIFSRTNQKSELTVGQTLKTASALLKAALYHAVSLSGPSLKSRTRERCSGVVSRVSRNDRCVCSCFILCGSVERYRLNAG